MKRGFDNQMIITLSVNTDKQGALDYARKIVDIFESRSVTVMVSDACKEAFLNCKVSFYGNLTDAIAKSDFCIAIGGDGTIMSLAKTAAISDKPVLGINFGRMGFIAGLEPQNADDIVKLTEAQFTIDRRMMLKVTVTSGENMRTLYALNDAVIARGALSRIIDLSVSLDDKIISHYRADGLLLSTPTGSTAYSLSAGGPVIDPTISCILLTPVCPHSLFSRSVLFADTARLTVQAENEANDEVFLTVDGQDSVKIMRGDRIIIEKANVQAQLIKIKDKNFYQILSDKFNERGTNQ